MKAIVQLQSLRAILTSPATLQTYDPAVDDPEEIRILFDVEALAGGAALHAVDLAHSQVLVVGVLRG